MIRIENLQLAFSDFRLDIEEIQVPAGSYLVVLGPSGSGKTLFVKCLAGVLAPGGGRIFYEDREITGLPPEKRNFGYVPQGSFLFPHYRVRENISFALCLRRLSPAEINRRVEELADQLGLGRLLERRVQELSGGETQKVALARALAAAPRVLLLDEPLSQLDALERRNLRQELKALKESLGLTVIHVTHDVEEAEALADHCMVLLGGKLLKSAPLSEIRGRSACSFLAALFGGEARENPAACGRECFTRRECPLLAGGGGKRRGQ
jgi:ABC-type sugar transport system ATPase subunit